MTDNILPKRSWVVTNFYEIHKISKILILIMFTHVNITWGRLRHPFLWDNAFLCNSTYQINQISLESLFLNVREKNPLDFSKSSLGNLKVSLRTKRVNLEIDFGKLSKCQNF